jgi:4,5-DOPA dioxygenase extradiol
MYPTLFISHGAPNTVLGNSSSKRNIQKFSNSLEKPKYIIVFSAHYLNKELMIINPSANELMYDFYGFEDELYNLKFPIKSNKEISFNIQKKLKEKNINLSIDTFRKSFDHGVWTTLSMMYKDLNIPVIQISIPSSYSKQELINLGEKLKVFKDEAMIICSGGLTHNIKDMSSISKPKPYALSFNKKVKNILEEGNTEELLKITEDENFKKNHPSTEHFLPLFIAYGSAKEKKAISFNSEIQFSNLSMECFAFDNKRD